MLSPEDIFLGGIEVPRFLRSGLSPRCPRVLSVMLSVFYLIPTSFYAARSLNEVESLLVRKDPSSIPTRVVD